AAALRHAEDAPAAAARLDGADAHVDGVRAADPAVAVGHPEGGVAGAGAGALGVHGADVGVDRVVEEEAGLAGVPRGDGADGDAVDAVRLDAVAAAAGGVHAVDADVPGADVPVGVVVDAHAEAGRAEPQVEPAEGDVGAVPDEDAEVRVAGHVEPGDLDVGDVLGAHGGVVGADRAGDVDRAAHFEDGVAGQVERLVGVHVAGAADDHLRLGGAAGGEAADGAAHGLDHAAAGVEGGAAVPGRPGAAALHGLGVVRAAAAVAGSVAQFDELPLLVGAVQVVPLRDPGAVGGGPFPD